MTCGLVEYWPSALAFTGIGFFVGLWVQRVWG